jgi:hypothetical protein
MKLQYFIEKELSPAALELVHFDIDSIKQVATAQKGGVPETWLVDPDAYEKNGRVMRDSPTSRMLAYSTNDHLVYATDGCNSCTRRIGTPLETLTDSELQAFAEDNDLRIDLLERLADLLHRST